MTVRLNLQQMQNQPIVTINGVNYKYTIYRTNQNGNEQDVTATENWKDLADEAVKVFDGQGPFERAEMIVTEDAVNPTLTSAKVFKKLDPARPDITEQDITARVNASPALQTAFNCIKQHFAPQAPAPQQVPQPIPPPPAQLPPPIPLPDYLVPIDNHGRCLDKTIADSILRKQGNAMPSPQEVEALADNLRTEAADLIRTNPDLRKDEKFIEALADSIRNIPTAPLNIQMIQREIRLDFGKYANTAVPEEIRDLEALFTYYSDYILENNRQNWLDRAFLYVLPSTTSGGRYQYAQLQRTDQGVVFIASRFPVEKDLSEGEVIFIFYNGTNHYLACAETHPGFPKENLIKDNHAGIFNTFKTNIHNITTHVDAALIPLDVAKIEMKNELDTLKNQFKRGFNALAALMYEHDHNAWENSDKALPEPSGLQYGEEQLYAMVRGQRMSRLGLEELDTLLNNEFTVDKLGEKIAAITA